MAKKKEEKIESPHRRRAASRKARKAIMEARYNK